MARKRRNYTDELKKKIVELYNSGKPRAELVREYQLYHHGSINAIIQVHLKQKITELLKKMN